MIRVLLVHEAPLSREGGAEISLLYHVEHAPPSVSVDVATPDQNPVLRRYDALVLANLRPSGGKGEAAEVEPMVRWAAKARSFAGFSLKTERDLHPCGMRDASCVSVEPLRKLWCSCSHLIPQAAENLYNSCSAVQFLSPGHQAVIGTLIRITTRQVVIGSPVDPGHFRVKIPWEDRQSQALILGDSIRVASSAESRAVEAGFEPVLKSYYSLPYSAMPDLLNQYQAVVVDPVMYHAFGRLAVEALMCGCKVLSSPRVGCMSWSDPVHASLRANDEFWDCILKGIEGGRSFMSRLRGLMGGPG